MYAQRAQASGKSLSAGPTAECLRLAHQIVGGGGGVYRRACFKVKRQKARGGGLPGFGAVIRCGLHLEPSFRLAALC